MNYLALSFLALFPLPILFLVGKLIHRRFFAVPPLPVGVRLIRIGTRWAFKHGSYLSQFSYFTKRGAALHAIGYRQKLARL